MIDMIASCERVRISNIYCLCRKQRESIAPFSSDEESRNLFGDFTAYTLRAISKVSCGDTTKMEFLISRVSRQMTEKFEGCSAMPNSAALAILKVILKTARCLRCDIPDLECFSQFCCTSNNLYSFADIRTEKLQCRKILATFPEFH